MKSKNKLMVMAMLSLCAALGLSDTFKHKETGDVFTGFFTQKTAGGKTLVYNSNEDKTMAVVLNEYEVTSDRNGRNDVISLFVLKQPGIFVSEAVSKEAANAIIETSNKGPQVIILQIDGSGGRANPMKTIADAVSKTNNCPVIAYISEGAYSSTAIIAMACDKVYINPSAEIGAVGPVQNGLDRGQNYPAYFSGYEVDFQRNEFLYVTSLAKKKNRPELLTRALIDKNIAVIEVANKDGSRVFIEEKDRKETQTLIRTLCEGLPAAPVPTAEPSYTPAVETPSDILLNLTANDAIKLGLVDETAESIADIASKMQISDARTISVKGIEKAMSKYTAARRKISDHLYRIGLYERDIESLSRQFSIIDNQMRTTMQTSQISRATGFGSNRRRVIDNYLLPPIETVTTHQPSVPIQLVYNQLATALRQVVTEYRTAMNMSSKWPGALPPGVTRMMLEKDMISASTELDMLLRYRP